MFISILYTISTLHRTHNIYILYILHIHYTASEGGIGGEIGLNNKLIQIKDNYNNIQLRLNNMQHKYILQKEKIDSLLVTINYLKNKARVCIFLYVYMYACVYYI